ncbi:MULTISPECIES: OsmC family protein [Idiomarinaceae]|uniref:OsmC family protein n=1 Tax=Pseudidiomarina fusca TaxID=2965078 RepID=A0ABU3KZW5_9GAMM|nr:MULTISPECIES: OsmC family protein [Idiomarinaceae]MDX1525948.1 OsmC family protein [Pseudidiomarina maritima]MDT7526701.1 OsmC family protein [Pseudidiomarina sp. GXY010]MRJ42890.1 OsmC family protein [Idiomarina sp. FeN1]NCU58441.1 OsmC family protein [Idiomarina sp. FenA--70]NCU61138.1 OsmC family protein [Idiomarina sp. FenBw--71]
MQAVVNWRDGLVFEAKSGSGHSLLMDGNKAEAASPMELVLMAAGGCSSVDVVSILEKARQQVSAVRCEVQGERADATPAVFTKVHLHFVVTGTDIADKHVERAVALSADKYCSVAKMLEASVTITHSFAIENS